MLFLFLFFRFLFWIRCILEEHVFDMKKNNFVLILDIFWQTQEQKVKKENSLTVECTFFCGAAAAGRERFSVWANTASQLDF